MARRSHGIGGFFRSLSANCQFSLVGTSIGSVVQSRDRQLYEATNTALLRLAVCILVVSLVFHNTADALAAGTDSNLFTANSSTVGWPGEVLTIPSKDASKLLAQAEVQPMAGRETRHGLPLIWQNNFTRELTDWPLLGRGWGLENRSFESHPGISGQVFKVFVPKGSIDPATQRKRGLPYGGTGFKATVAPQGLERAVLRYKVRFPPDFAPGRGGKLPGLCGGACNGGGSIPNGKDGFSTRYMWLTGLRAIVYTYIPSSVKFGTPIGANKIFLSRGEWIQLEQEVKLNTVGFADGHIKVWVDGRLAMEQGGLEFRHIPTLKINRLYFDVFYGGGDDTWAAPKDTSVEFAEFSVYGQ